MFKVIPSNIILLNESNQIDLEKIVTREFQSRIMKSDLNSIKFYDTPAPLPLDKKT